jgi:hypothetical protein
MNTPQEDMDEARRLAEQAAKPNSIGPGTVWSQRQALIYATLAVAGFTRDADTGADHTHDVCYPDQGHRVQSEPGRPT